MGMTLTQKILAAHAGLAEVKAGQLINAKLDIVLGNDITTPVAINEFERAGFNSVFDKQHIAIVLDHFVPNKDIKSATQSKQCREFANKYDILNFYDVGQMGIEHALLPEKGIVTAGDCVIGADSHTCTYGALGAFGTGVGCTDLLYGMVTGTSWVLVPETVKFNLIGKLPDGVYPRDLMLTIIGKIGANGVNYQVMEFTGDGAKTLSVNDRMVLCNLAVEAGAKTAIFEADEIAMEYLRERGREPKAVFHSDEDAVYVREYTFDLSQIEPVAARPDFVDDVVPAKEVCGIRIDEAFLGSCNNGRIDDLRVGASVLKGRRVADHVRFLVVPASQEVYLQALEEGLISVFMESGAISKDETTGYYTVDFEKMKNEVLISTGTRNFKGRAGHPSSKVYLGSAATVTASAVKGEICTADML